MDLSDSHKQAVGGCTMITCSINLVGLYTLCGASLKFLIGSITPCCQAQDNYKTIRVLVHALVYHFPVYTHNDWTILCKPHTSYVVCQKDGIKGKDVASEARNPLMVY